MPKASEFEIKVPRIEEALGFYTTPKRSQSMTVNLAVFKARGF